MGESKSLDMIFGKKPDDFSPGMLGHDSPGLRKAEITNGRVAMVAIVVFAFEEAIFKVRTAVVITVACLTSLPRSTCLLSYLLTYSLTYSHTYHPPVVKETSIFFKPI